MSIMGTKKTNASTDLQFMNRETSNKPVYNVHNVDALKRIVLTDQALNSSFVVL